MRPKPGQTLELANGDRVKVTEIFHSTQPEGTYRVGYWYDQKHKGTIAWWRAGWWKEYQPMSAPIVETP